MKEKRNPPPGKPPNHRGDQSRGRNLNVTEKSATAGGPGRKSGPPQEKQGAPVGDARGGGADATGICLRMRTPTRRKASQRAGRL